MMNYLTQLMPPKQSLILSEKDYYRLHSAIDQEKRMGKTTRKRINRIRHLLRNANFYPIRLFPSDVVTMNSVIELNGRNGSVWTVRLVYPHEANKEYRRVSIFSNLGMKLLGQHKGVIIKADRVWVGKIVYQPEGFNHFHL